MSHAAYSSRVPGALLVVHALVYSVIPKAPGIAKCLLISRGPCSVTIKVQYVNLFGVLTGTLCFVCVNLVTAPYHVKTVSNTADVPSGTNEVHNISRSPDFAITSSVFISTSSSYI